MAKVPKDEIDRRVKEAAEKLEISDLLYRKPKEMSGGQRQRVAVGRALLENQMYSYLMNHIKPRCKTKGINEG